MENDIQGSIDEDVQTGKGILFQTAIIRWMVFHPESGEPWAWYRKKLILLVGANGKGLETTIKLWFAWGSLTNTLCIYW